MLFILVGSTLMFADEIKEEDFYLQIKLIGREKSKDSNSQHYHIEVKDREVTYHYKYYGFPFPPNRERSSKYRLSDEALSEIIQTIKDEKIDVSTEEKRSTKSNGGVTMRVHLSLFLKLEGKTTESEISGNVKIFRGDGKIKGELIKNTNYINSVKSLIGDLER